MKKTAWYNEEQLPKSMLDAVQGKISGWKLLEESDHFPALKKCMDLCTNNKKVLDLGCGAGEISRVFKDIFYTGADLKHVIDKVAKIKNPNANFIIFDANTDDYSFFQDYDVIVMNSFLSEMPDYFKILNKILFYSKKYIILHRQEFGNEKSHIKDYQSYGNLITSKTIINYTEFIDLCKKNNFIIEQNINSFSYESNMKTLLLKNAE